MYYFSTTTIVLALACSTSTMADSVSGWPVSQSQYDELKIEALSKAISTIVVVEK